MTIPNGPTLADLESAVTRVESLITSVQKLAEAVVKVQRSRRTDRWIGGGMALVFLALLANLLYTTHEISAARIESRSACAATNQAKSALVQSFRAAVAATPVQTPAPGLSAAERTKFFLDQAAADRRTRDFLASLAPSQC